MSSNASSGALPFDQLQRYRLVAEIVQQVRGQDEVLDVLDVGGRTGLLRQFLPGDRIAAVDPEPPPPEAPTPRLVLGTGSALPFADDAFDLVCAFDTLEHVPPDQRQAFVSECVRVARRWVVLAGPYTAPAVDAAEQELARFLREELEFDHRYLREHLENGLPERALTEQWLREGGARWSHSPTRTWSAG